MKRYNILLAGLLFLLFFISCENEEQTWGDTSYARITGPSIWTHSTDSMIFTFSTLPTDSIEYAVEAEIYVQGKIVDHDRSVHLQVNAEKTTASENTYSFPKELILKGGQHSINFKIILYRSAEMQQKDVHLSIKIAPTGDLQAGVSNFSSLNITWNDKITQPTNWDNLIQFFGTYSETKYRFIISTLGVYLFPFGEDDEFTWGKMWNYRLEMISALDTYNTDPKNPGRPMKDENGGIVSF